MGAARDLLRAATPNGDGVLELDGEPLTSERVKTAIRRVFVEHGASCDDFVVSHGPQSAIGHHLGEGALRAGEPIVIDIWPRDDASACSADMTRTFVVGDVPDEVAEWHRLCKEALDRARRRHPPGRHRPGRSSTARATSSRRPAIRPSARRREGETLADGFFHSLGHGVGLEVHEQPLLGMAGHDELVAGDVARGRAGPVPLGLRRPAPRGPRPRHRGRRREAHAVPVRPRAVAHGHAFTP